MYFRPIVPVDIIPKVVDKYVYHFTLAHLPTHYTAYTRRTDRHIILDNGVYEGLGVTPDTLMEAARTIKPDIVVLPDQRNDSDRTLIQAMHIAHTYPSQNFMYVVQRSTDIEDLNTLRPFANITYLGIPKFFNHDRVPYVQQLPPWVHKRYTLHALGFLDTDAYNELPLLAANGVFSIDSARPAWLGCQGYDVGTYGAGINRKTDKRTDLLTPTMAHVDLIMHNIEATYAYIRSL